MPLMHVMRAVGPGAGREFGRGRARVRLAHAEAHDGAAGEQVGQAASLLRRLAYSAKVRIGPKLPACTTSALRGQTSATCSIAITASISVPPWPPSALRDRDAHQALPAHQLRHLERKARIVGARERVLGEMRLREAAHRFGEEFLLLGEVEIHRSRPLGSALTVSHARRHCPLTPPSPRLGARSRPLGLLAVDVGRIGLGRAGQRLGAVGGERGRLRRRQRAAQRRVELVDDRPRRAGRRHDAVVQHASIARHAGFRDGRQLGKQRRARRPGDRQRAHLAVAAPARSPAASS